MFKSNRQGKGIKNVETGILGIKKVLVQAVQHFPRLLVTVFFLQSLQKWKSFQQLALGLHLYHAEQGSPQSCASQCESKLPAMCSICLVK